MASANLLALIDDIASLLDDVAVLSKMAAKKTTGVLGDDLALNANQVSGVSADRELPVVWAVAKGSLINKLILVPSALLLSAISPLIITFLLMLGGLYLCYEGFEKIVHSLLHRGDSHPSDDELATPNTLSSLDVVAYEKQKIKGAIRTDFILSAEIIVITLGTVASAAYLSKVVVVSFIAFIMTVGVYGLVAGIVKLDDLGIYLLQRSVENGSRLCELSGRGILWFAPFLMKLLSVVGTLAMFLVGGGILFHGIPSAHHIEESALSVFADSRLMAIADFSIPVLLTLVCGLAAGGVAMGVVELFKNLVRRSK